MRSTKNTLKHNSMRRGWICVLLCRCGCSIHNIGSRTETILTERLDKTTLNTL